ncbi:hypothetical protein FHS59_002144 [Algoriphagus iocasae]|uniref:S1/P1 Nuclease n=1 Tax=Algoriphagus iocasae TaxID=1836499 RepID=A0A841MQQ9_9BACT|nr:S1/P1 nuclease [Algoriphagus iocasae]MBB6326516.1 hypothetical protein [Algoriphagus iocasae]
MKFNKSIVLTFIMSLMVSQVFAWGQLGHYLIGYMTSMQLKNSTRKKVERVLYPMSIGRSGTWMDEIKSDRAFDYVNSWHYLTSKNGEFDPSLQEKGGNAYEAIQQIKAELIAGNLTVKEEAEKLKMLIHIVEDIHQPLHVGTGEDRGGNDVKLEFFYQNSNLHSVWDSGIIDRWSMSYTEIGNELSRRLTPEMEDQYRNSTIDDWLKEAVALRPMVYKLPENMKLSYNYGYDNREIVEERLIAASVRLAMILEEIY